MLLLNFVLVITITTCITIFVISSTVGRYSHHPHHSRSSASPSSPSAKIISVRITIADTHCSSDTARASRLYEPGTSPQRLSQKSGVHLPESIRLGREGRSQSRIFGRYYESIYRKPILQNEVELAEYRTKKSERVVDVFLHLLCALPPLLSRPPVDAYTGRNPKPPQATQALSPKP